MATIKQIAKECNVSITTVSNILNGKKNAGEETRKKVLETAKNMEYVPNYMAKNLKNGATKIIGIITEDLTVFNCPEIVDGINALLEECGYTFLLSNLRLYKKYDNTFYHTEEYRTQVEDEFRTMQAKQVEGIIYICAHSRYMHCIPNDFSIPIVVAYGFTDRPEIPSVTFNDEKAAYEAVKELLHKGHKKIGVIAGERESLHTIERLRGYRRALEEADIIFNEDLVEYGDWQRGLGYEACKSLLDKNIKGIFAMSDVMAGGIYDYAKEAELEVGTDLFVIGFDNREIAIAYNPGLTTMALPLSEIGRKSAEIIIKMLNENFGDKERCTYKIECNIARRGSL